MCILNVKFSKWEANLHQLYVKTTQIINRSGCIFIFNIDRRITSSKLVVGNNPIFLGKQVRL